MSQTAVVSFKCVCCGVQNTGCKDNAFCACKAVKLRYCKIHKKHYQYVCGTNHDCPDCEWDHIKYIEKAKNPSIIKTKLDVKCPACLQGTTPKIYVSVGGTLECLNCLRASHANGIDRIECATCRVFIPMAQMNWRQPANSVGKFHCNECIVKKGA